MTTDIVNTGRCLVLTEDPELILAQLNGTITDISYLLKQPLLDNISTDEMTPGWCCFWYDKKLADFVFTGLRGGSITEGMVNQFQPEIIVAGQSKGCGSSREHAPYAEFYAGAKVIAAQSFEKIYRQNCHNIGLLTTTEFDLVERLMRGESLTRKDFVSQLSTLEEDIVLAGGLMKMNFNDHGKNLKLSSSHNNAAISVLNKDRKNRATNPVWQIIQQHCVKQYGLKEYGAEQFTTEESTSLGFSVGDSLLCRVDVRFSHEYVTAMAASIFQQPNKKAKVFDPKSVFCFTDHLSLADELLAKRANGQQLITRTHHLAERQQSFALKQGIGHFGKQQQGGSYAICHNAILEEIAGPGQIIIGTDSHTCTAGALGCLAFGVGTTDMAFAWKSGLVQLKVPPVIAIELKGRLDDYVSAKDLVLHILATSQWQKARNSQAIIYYFGEGLRNLEIEERATLTNMAVEMGATSAICEVDEKTMAWLAKRKDNKLAVGFNKYKLDISTRLQLQNKEAFESLLSVDTSSVVPMIAKPSDPTNLVTLAALTKTKIDIAYGGSCTGGKCSDMDIYAAVIEKALSKNQRVAPRVDFYIQYGSQKVKNYVLSKGFDEIFRDAGVKIIEPSCGACINAGPGVSTDKAQVTISAQNRNFPGRSGPGSVYLASPWVVAASAVAGRIASPESLFSAINNPTTNLS